MLSLGTVIAIFNVFCFREYCSFYFVNLYSLVVSLLHTIFRDFKTCTILFSGEEKKIQLSSDVLEVRIKRFLKEAILRECIL